VLVPTVAPRFHFPRVYVPIALPLSPLPLFCTRTIPSAGYPAVSTSFSGSRPPRSSPPVRVRPYRQVPHTNLFCPLLSPTMPGGRWFSSRYTSPLPGRLCDAGKTLPADRAGPPPPHPPSFCGPPSPPEPTPCPDPQLRRCGLTPLPIQIPPPPQHFARDSAVPRAPWGPGGGGVPPTPLPLPPQCRWPTGQVQPLPPCVLCWLADLRVGPYRFFLLV